MPIIPDDQMQSKLDRTLEYVAPDEDYSFREKLRASYRVDNEIGSFFSQVPDLPDYTVSDDFNPYDHLTDEEKTDENFAKHVSFANSEKEMDAVRDQVARERKDRAKITGIDGFVAGLMTGVVSPMNLIPVGGSAYKAYKSGSLLKGAFATGVVAAGSVGAQEMALHATQLERTGEESSINMTGAFLLGGVLGGGSAALNRKFSPEQIAEVEKTMDMDTPDVNTVVPKGSKSVGASETWGDVQVKGKFVRGALKALRSVDPLARVMTSDSQSVRKYGARLAENPLELEGFKGMSVEQVSKTRQSMLFNQGMMVSREQFDLMRKSGVNMRRGEFNKLVSKEVRNPGTANNQYAKAAADSWVEKTYKPATKDAIDAKIFGDDMEVDTAYRYLNRRWNKNKVSGELDKFIQITSKWLKTERTDLDSEELKDLAQQIGYKLIGSPDGTFKYDQEVSVGGGGKSGGGNLRAPFKARAFKIPDELVEEFLENDIEELAQIYLRHVVPDTQLVKEFGPNIEDALSFENIKQDIRDDYGRLMKDAKTPKARTNLNGKMKADIEALAGMRDRIRGTYDLPTGPTWGRRFNAAFRNLNYVRLMGGVVASSVPDVGKVVMAEGFMRAFGDGFAPMIRNIGKNNPAKKEARYYGIAAETVTSGRVEAIADINDYALGGTKIERGLENLSSHFGNITLMNQWNDMMKTTHALAMQARVYDDLSAGKFDSRLSKLGLAEHEAQEIHALAKKHGEVINGARLFHPEKWENQDMAFLWASALRKESDRVIIVPGQDKPLFMSRDIGKTVLQFRSFMLASTQRTMLASLQGQEENALGGLLLMTGMGSMVYAFKQWDAGREISDDPMVWAAEGIDRSGALGILMEASNTAEKISGNRFGLRSAMGIAEPASRFASRSEYESALGPTYGSLVPNIIRAAQAGTGGNDWSEYDTRAVRRMLPYQNMTLLRRGIDAAEKYTHEALFE